MTYSKFSKLTLLSLFLGFGFIACSDSSDDPAVEANFTVTIENVATVYPLLKSGVFNTPVGADAPGPIFPGDAYEFTFTAPIGSKLSLATMFVQSNDWFYAPGQDGLDLYNADGSQVTGDVTSAFNLYDAGTEADEEPGTGANQAPRQGNGNTGAVDPDNTVRAVTAMGIPADEDVLRVTLTSMSATGFRVRIENVSTTATLQTSTGTVPVPLAPGGWAVHAASETAVLFEVGQPDYGNGLEGVAEDGSLGAMETSLTASTGLTTPLAPGVFAAYNGANPFFTSGSASNNGLEGVAEDGSTDELATSVAAFDGVRESGVFAQPVGASANGPLLPGNSYSFSFTAQEGDLLNFATMFVQSNDLFYAATGNGITLFQNGTPISGDYTSSVTLWDAGTEENEEPGVGPNQVTRQGGSNIGPADSNTSVRVVSDNYTYPGTSSILRLTISAN